MFSYAAYVLDMCLKISTVALHQTLQNFTCINIIKTKGMSYLLVVVGEEGKLRSEGVVFIMNIVLWCSI